MATSRTERRLPVFAFPEHLRFNERNQRLILTIYNPYDFILRFQILCNDPNKYTVQDSHGVLKPHCCVDIVIRHQKSSQVPCNSNDKFRVDLYHGNKLLGRKHIQSSLTKEESTPTSDEDHAEYHTISSSTTKEGNELHSSPGWLTVLVGVVSLLVLLLPLEGESASWPQYCHVTINQKLFASFMLG